ncbi:MAG: stage II sporulation protein P [Anaerotignum sp.]|nr:stage II sporulation protein P [Anaerotignum sp.]
MKKKKVWLNIIGLLFFALAMPLFFRMGGGKIVMAEVLPGQAVTEGISLSALFEKEEQITVSAGLIGTDDVEFTQAKAISVGGRPLHMTAEELAKMKDISYLRSKYYIVDSRTSLLEGDVSAEEALSLDLTIEKSEKEPKILIFHTHIHEGFADSDMSKGLSEGIWGVGEELKRILEEEYGIAVLHDAGQYDMVNGKGQTTGAYERMEPPIREVLKKYPSIEVCIDLHRDGVPESTRLVTEIDGKLTAQVMFFNGLCRLSKDGKMQAISGLENPYVKENLAFSLQMKTAADSLFPDFARKIYLNAYRFSLHFMPRSSLVEVGAQTNTKAEAKNAMKPLARILAEVLTE